MTLRINTIGPVESNDAVSIQSLISAATSAPRVNKDNQFSGDNDFSNMPTVGESPVVESGEDISGSTRQHWVKFADGTMVARGAFTTSTTANANSAYGTTAGEMSYINAVVNLSEPFIDNTYTVSAFPVNRGVIRLAGLNPTGSEFSINVNDKSLGAEINVTWIAVGRWK